MRPKIIYICFTIFFVLPITSIQLEKNNYFFDVGYNKSTRSLQSTDELRRGESPYIKREPLGTRSLETREGQKYRNSGEGRNDRGYGRSLRKNYDTR